MSVEDCISVVNDLVDEVSVDALGLYKNGHEMSGSPVFL